MWVCIYTHTYIYIYVEEFLDKVESQSTTEKIESDSYGQSSKRQSTNHETDLSATDLFEMVFYGEEGV